MRGGTGTMMSSRLFPCLLVAVFSLLLAPGRALAQADPCAGVGPLAALELGGDESGIGGTGHSGDQSGMGGTGVGGDESGIGGTGRSGGESGMGGTGIALEESGVGGTGVSEDPSGIGGTGIYGTLTAFGSVCVNGLRVQYPEDVAVEWNGELRDLSALALGQVLWVVAGGSPDDLSTRKIAIHSAVLGEVSGVDRANRRLEVSGRAVSVPEGAYLGEGLDFDTLAVGDRLDVSGLQSADGEIVASRIDLAGLRDRDVSAAPKPEALVAATEGLRWISVEGFLTGRPQQPRLGGIALDLSSIPGQPDRVQRGKRVRARGRLLPDGVLRVEPFLRAQPGRFVPRRGFVQPWTLTMPATAI